MRGDVTFDFLQIVPISRFEGVCASVASELPLRQALMDFSAA